MTGGEWSSSVSGRRQEGAAPVSEGERSTWGDSWFPCGEATRGCSGVAVADSRSRAASALNQGGRQLVGPIGPKSLFGLDTIVEIKQAVKMEWAGKERFFGRKKIMEKNFDCCSLNKKI
jgi:hypothetical protein